MILDSTYVFDLMSADRDAFQKGVELVEQGEIQWLPTTVVAEAFYGAGTERSNATRSDIRNRLLSYPRIDLDEEIGHVAGQLLATADDEADGNSGVGWNDAHIAATADVLNETVLTRNVTDFERLGVPVESY
jgi:predicted nucleic acid-binding protein